MTIRRRSRSAHTLAARAFELAWAVPQVVGHRLAGMASPAALKTTRGRKELVRMVAEKHSAFGESWQAMTTQALRAHGSLAAALARASVPTTSLRRANRSALALQLELQQATLAILGKGLAPVHRRAVANAKRLGKKRR
jgi:hypothetical protein